MLLEYTSVMALRTSVRFVTVLVTWSCETTCEDARQPASAMALLLQEWTRCGGGGDHGSLCSQRSTGRTALTSTAPAVHPGAMHDLPSCCGSRTRGRSTSLPRRSRPPTACSWSILAALSLAEQHGQAGEVPASARGWPGSLRFPCRARALAGSRHAALSCGTSHAPSGA